MTDNTNYKAGDVSNTIDEIQVETMNDQSNSPFFKKLPLELRRMVYDYCSFVGEVAPYSRNKTKQSLPYVPLLRTCKAVNFDTEPIVYENTFTLSVSGAIAELFHITLPTPARKLLLKSVEVSLRQDDCILEDRLVAWNIRVPDLCEFLALQGGPTPLAFRTKSHRRKKTQLRDAAWKRKIAPILDDLTLDWLVLDLNDTFCRDRCSCRMAAMAITCFDKGFKLQAPKLVEVKGWNTGRADVEVMVQVCFGLWTIKRVGHVAGSSDLALDMNSEAEKWVLEMARKEEQE